MSSRRTLPSLSHVGGAFALLVSAAVLPSAAFADDISFRPLPPMVTAATPLVTVAPSAPPATAAPTRITNKGSKAASFQPRHTETAAPVEAAALTETSARTETPLDRVSVKLGWSYSDLWIEVSPAPIVPIGGQDDASIMAPSEVNALVTGAAGREVSRVDWYTLDLATIAHAGNTTKITLPERK
jgi:hypothetical protein